MTERIPPFLPSELVVKPVEEADTIPSSWYTDPAFHDWDQQTLFAHNWQCVGHVARVANEGEYFATDIGGNPVLVVRDKDGILRAFYNVCRHRGGPLVTDESGCVNALQCKYHGWTYWLDGMLRGVPEFDRVKLFDKKDFGLTPVPIKVWQGLIFLRLEDGENHLDKTLTEIEQRIAPLDLTELQFHSQTVYDIDCNWKVYIDNYLEGYHIPHVHPELNKLLDYREYATETFPFHSLQYSPFKKGENIYGSDGGEAYYYFIFPNIMLNILPGRLQTNLILPLEQQRCRVIFDYYYADLHSSEAKKLIREDIEYSDVIQQEDIDICLRVQCGLNSRAYDKGRFSVTRESGVYHFQSLLKKMYRR
ncbi:MAG: aromatic ring-hydroxylating oxygenase subunit alpha [Calditrichia bacterium]